MATDRPDEQPHVAADLPDWDTVYERQLQRADLAREWLDALALQPGERVLDAGCGTGYVSLEAARRVGPAGRVYAVDNSAEALAYLGRLQAEQGIAWVERIVADAATLPALPGHADAALVTLVLHHADDPAGYSATWRGCCPTARGLQWPSSTRTGPARSARRASAACRRRGCGPGATRAASIAWPTGANRPSTTSSQCTYTTASGPNERARRA